VTYILVRSTSLQSVQRPAMSSGKG
jgi:hypothetical protein